METSDAIRNVLHRHIHDISALPGSEPLYRRQGRCAEEVTEPGTLDFGTFVDEKPGEAHLVEGDDYAESVVATPLAGLSPLSVPN
jgi:hypothetical protein